MNELKIFENPSSEEALAYFTELNSDSYPGGVVYILEWGPFVKIGCTTKIKERMTQLQRMARNYANVSVGRVAVTPLHNNHRKTEANIHQYFDEKRFASGELFNVEFEEAVKFLKNVQFKRYTKAELQQIENSKEQTFEFFKSVVRGECLEFHKQAGEKCYNCMEFLNFAVEQDMRRLAELQFLNVNREQPTYVVITSRGDGTQIVFTKKPFDLLLNWTKFGMLPSLFAIAELNDADLDMKFISEMYKPSCDELTGIYSENWLNVASCIDSQLAG